MRDEFAKTLLELARKDRDLILITGDLGFGVLTAFRDELPDQYLNAGVAEQNMTGIAAGMALEGKKVFTYSIGVFNTFRCLEQIRNDICHHGANVKIVSIGSGLCYGALGPSHHCTEDIAVLRAMPNLCLLSPGDKTEARLATRLAWEHDGPCYLRLGRGGEPDLYSSDPDLEWGKALHLKGRGDVVILATGGIMAEVVDAVRLLQNDGVETSLYSMPFLHPFDTSLVRRLAADSRLIITVEEHIVGGGLGSIVAEELVSMNGHRASMLRIGLQTGHIKTVGDQDYLREENGLNSDNIRLKILDALNGTHS